MKMKRSGWIEEYQGCGCAIGPVPKTELVGYCAKHGGNFKNRYYIRPEAWWKVARREGRLCRLCHEPVDKAHWKQKDFDHLCWQCWMREMDLPHDPNFRLARE